MASKDEVMTFSLGIESRVHQKNMTYMDAVIEHCEETGLEVEVAAKMISGALKSKIKLEAEDLHFIARSNTGRLPI